MIPIELRVYRFRSFTKEVVFRFPQGPGLFFMQGDNQVEPRLEGNGAGKSSLWEALLWCLFGKTSRGLKAGDAANWDEGKGCRVEFEFDVEQPAWMRYTVSRTWSPNSWKLTNGFGDVIDLAKDETNPLDQWLRLGFDSFLHCVFLAQAQPLFLDLRPEPKAALFSEIMDLDHWLKLSDRASNSAREQDVSIRQLEREIAGLTGRLESLDDQLLQEQRQNWERQRSERLASMSQEHGRLVTKSRLLKEAKRNMRESIDLMLIQEDELRDELRDKKATLDDSAAIRQAVRETMRDRDRDVDAWLDHLDHASSNDPECPHCRQPISAEWRAKSIEQTRDELARAKRAAEKASNEAERIELSHRTREREYQKALAALNEAEQRRKDAEGDLHRMDRDISFIEAELDRLEERAEVAEMEPNVYDRLLAEQATTRRNLTRDLQRQQRQLEEAQEQFILRQSWVRWFKEIRLEQIGEALTELEIEVNSCVNAKGLVGWELHFEVDDLKRSGSIQRGFTVNVLSPHNPRPVPWEAWSGGESQRLRVACQEGLANLIRARTGTMLDLEVWDEPTQWLSPQGVLDLLDSLSDRARREGRQIWVVDHRSLGYGNFNGTAVIRKTEAGSSVDTSALYSFGHEAQPESAVRSPAPDERRPRTRAD